MQDLDGQEVSAGAQGVASDRLPGGRPEGESPEPC